MSSAAEGNDSGSSGGSQGMKKAKAPRRSWSRKEEETLIAAMKEIIADGWRSDNGFKSGYQNKLEKLVKKVYPTTDLKAYPHINSRICSWKKNYNSLSSILSRSGVGFNTHGRHMIDCNDDQWEQINEVDANAINMRYRSWPHYEDWQEIFGKDRATGDAAEDILDACANINLDGSQSDMKLPDDMSMDTHSAHEGNAGNQNIPHSEKQRGKKRKSTDDMSGVCEVLRQIGDKTDARLGELVKRIGYDFEVSTKRKEAFDLLACIQGLSLEDRFDICDHLGKEIEKLDVFMGLPEVARSPYVMRILKMLRKY